jgi:hypothetical protein
MRMSSHGGVGRSHVRSRQDAIVTQLPAALTPSPDERGLATSDPDRLAAGIAQSWALFAAMVDDVDLDAVSRAKGLLAREVVIPLGAWDDNRPLPQLLDEARAGVVGEHDQGALVDAVRAAHRDEPDDEVREALRRQGDDMEHFLYGDGLASFGAMQVASMLGTLPVATFLHAACYPLATSALDLEQAGARVPDVLLDNGLLGLVDTIGALAARQGVTASIAALTPHGVIAVGATGGAWRTAVLEPGDLDGDLPGSAGPSVEGSARLILDITSGRADIPTAVRRKEVAVHDLTGLLALTPIVEQVPGIPGRAALVAAIRATSALSGLWNRLPFGRG